MDMSKLLFSWFLEVLNNPLNSQCERLDFNFNANSNCSSTYNWQSFQMVKIYSFKVNPKKFQIMILGKRKRGKTTLKINSLVIHETNFVVQNS